jgi:outer membrane protein, multidrug efflux system
LSRAQAATAERQTATLALAASITETYFNWQVAAARAELTQHAIAVLEEGRRLAELRSQAQLDNDDTLLQMQQAMAARREQLIVLQGEQQLQRVLLAALAGVGEDQMPALEARPLPRVAAALPNDVGTNLLARRPDITASRARVEAALHDVEQARAAYYPDISLNALASLSSIELDRLLRADSAAPAVGLAINLPLFDAGLRRARHGAASADLAAAIAASNWPAPPHCCRPHAHAFTPA